MLRNNKSIEKRERLSEISHVVLFVNYDYDYDYEHEHDARRTRVSSYFGMGCTSMLWLNEAVSSGAMVTSFAHNSASSSFR